MSTKSLKLKTSLSNDLANFYHKNQNNRRRLTCTPSRKFVTSLLFAFALCSLLKVKQYPRGFSAQVYASDATLLALLQKRRNLHFTSSFFDMAPPFASIIMVTRWRLKPLKKRFMKWKFKLILCSNQAINLKTKYW